MGNETPEDSLLDAFVASRTTLEDLSERTAALGMTVSGSTIAALLTGKCELSATRSNTVAAAINARLAELAMPATAPYRNAYTSTPVNSMQM